MKNLIIIFLIFLFATAKGTDYTVGSDGDYTSITALNADKATFSAGDNIDFKRGETFYGTIEIAASGTSGNPITYGAYGTGADPIIYGFTEITSWTNEGGGIYSKAITSDSKSYMVTVDGVNTAMGRFPNSSYLIYESVNALISITDDELLNTPNWTGAEVIIRRNNWILRRSTIADHTNTVITYNGSGWAAKPDYGYFFQSDTMTLDVIGEWHHDYSAGKFYMYFGAETPADYDVQVATKNNLIDIQGETYITIDGLTLSGAIDDVVKTTSASSYLTVKNTTIEFADGNGIYVNGSYSLIDSCIIRDCNSNGIHIINDYVTASNNTIHRIGLIVGGGSDYEMGIMANETEHTVIEYNTIDSCGYNGIGAWGLNDTIRYNFINYSCLNTNDGAGIYTVEPLTTSLAGSLFDHNIVLNTIGTIDGTAAYEVIVEGFYIDDLGSNVTVTNNTFAYNTWSGLKFHGAFDSNAEYNKCFANGWGLWLLADTPIYGNTIRYNQFVAKSGDLTEGSRYSYTPDPPALGTLDYNIYARPIDDDYHIYEYYNKTDISRTLAQWKTYSSQDANSTGTPVAITSDDDMRLIYNATKDSVTYDVTGNSVTDIDGTTYSSTIGLASFKSVIIVGTDVDLVTIEVPPTPTPTNKKYYIYKGKGLR